MIMSSSRGSGSEVSGLNPLYEDVVLRMYHFFSLLNEDIVRDFFMNWPKYYKYWWMTLYEEAPHHIFIETGLICFIVWLIFIRRTVDPNKSSNREKLSKKEVDWLVETWQPEPLVPALNKTQKTLADSMMVSHKTIPSPSRCALITHSPVSVHNSANNNS